MQATITEAKAGGLDAREAIREVITDFVIGILGAVGIFLIEMAFR